MYGAAKGSSDDVVCVIPGKQVRVFGKAIHTLSKMSDDLYIEARDGSFHIRTVCSQPPRQLASHHVVLALLSFVLLHHTGHNLFQTHCVPT